MRPEACALDYLHGLKMETQTAALGFVTTPCHGIVSCAVRGDAGTWRRGLARVQSRDFQKARVTPGARQLTCAAGLEKHREFADYVVDLQDRICKVRNV